MLHETSFRRVRAIIKHMYQVLPDRLTINFKRPRGLFDLGQKILKSLFCVATTEQLDAMRNTAQQTMNDNADSFRNWEKVAYNVSSFMSVANHRLDTFANILRDHEIMLQGVFYSVYELNADVYSIKLS